LDRRVHRVIQFLSNAITDAITERNGLPAGPCSDEFEVKDRLSMEELSRSVNLSRSRLRALFKSETGMTPGQYVKRLKIEKAKELAEKSNMTMGQILAGIGVSDESHFRRDFKKVIGTTLSECRYLHYQCHNEE
jgi:AraC-like DNA-binding protein